MQAASSSASSDSPGSLDSPASAVAPEPSSVIQELPSLVIDQIAAGEVIERPASAVKELVENAIDAGAARVRVELHAGGLKMLQVTDDGCGMSPADARLCLLRHATSKLRSADDLFAIRTLGFRGEALASIASVSRLTLTTRRQSDCAGTRVQVRGGVVEEVTSVGCPVGTTMRVEDLFYNTPARLKFMRAPATEQAHAVEAAMQGVLAAGRCGLVVVSDRGRRLIDIPATEDGRERVRAALGKRIKEVFSFATTIDGIEIRGFLGPAGVDRGDTKGLWFYVNGRHVRDRLLQRAVLNGFGLEPGARRYPIALIHIGVHPSAVDVNVHPRKSEVRFRDGSAVFRAVTGAVANALAREPGLLPLVDGWVAGGAPLAKAAPVVGGEVSASSGEPASEVRAGQVTEGEVVAGGRVEATQHDARGRAAEALCYRKPLRPLVAPEEFKASVSASVPRPVVTALAQPHLFERDGPREREGRVVGALGGVGTAASGTGGEADDPLDGVHAVVPQPLALWVHAASVGETAGNVAYQQPHSLGLRRCVGMMSGRYALCELDGARELASGLAVVDLAVLRRERMRQRLLEQLCPVGGGPPVVRAEVLLFPEVLADLDRGDLDWLEEHWGILASWGVEVEPVGPRRFAVRAVPQVAAGGNVGALAAAVVALGRAFRGGGEDPGPPGASNDSALSRAQAEAIARVCAVHGAPGGRDGEHRADLESEARVLLDQAAAVASARPEAVGSWLVRFSEMELRGLFRPEVGG